MRSRPALSLSAFLLALLACSLGGTRPSPGASITATPAAQQDIPISATPIRFAIPYGLATGATAETIDVVTDQTGAPWDIAPAHLQLTLQGYSVEITSHVPQILVYSAQEYAGMNPAAAESLRRLQAVLRDPGGSYDRDTLPRVPFFNAGQVVATQQEVIHFGGGSGVRFVTQYAQDVSPISNGGLIYHFEGLSDDGQDYIIAVLPVNLPFLPADNNPASPLPADGIPFPSASASSDAYANYYQQVTAKIDAASAGSFSPSLGLLDRLMQSITVQP